MGNPTFSSEMIYAIKKNHIFWFCLALHLLGLFILCPSYSSDSAGYITFADQIINTPQILWHLDWEKDLFPASSYRMLLYPAVIAMCKLISAKYWSYLLCFIQIIVFSLTVQVFYNFSKKTLSNKKWLLLALVVFTIFPRTFRFNLSILTDSFFNSFALLFLIFTMRLLIVKDTKASSFLIGVLGVGLFVRESFVFFTASLLPILAYAFFKATNKCASLKKCACLVAPIGLTFLACLSWNTWRSGQTFLTTGSSTAMFVTFGEFCQANPSINIWTEGTPIDKIAPKYFSKFTEEGEMRDMLVGVKILQDVYGLNSLDIARMNQQRYKGLWHSYPLEMMILSIKKINDGIILIPILGLYKYLACKADEGLPAQEIVKKDPKLKMIVSCVQSLDCLLKVAFFIFSIVLFPYFAWCRKELELRDFLPLWAGCWIFTGLYAMIHLEMRYIMPYSTIMTFLILLLYNRVCLKKMEALK